MADRLAAHIEAVRAERDQYAAEIANLRDLIRRYGDDGMIPASALRLAFREGPPPREPSDVALIAWDPHTADQPHQSDDGPGWVHYMYEARSAWMCQCCEALMLATADDPDGIPCRGCGAVDVLGPILRPCGIDAHFEEVERG